MRRRNRRLVAAIVVVAVILAVVLWPEDAAGPDPVEMSWGAPDDASPAFEIPAHRTAGPPPSSRPARPRDGRPHPDPAPVRLETEDEEPVLLPVEPPLVEQEGAVEIEIEVGAAMGDSVEIWIEPLTGLDTSLHRRRRVVEVHGKWYTKQKLRVGGLAAVTWRVWAIGTEPVPFTVEPDETASCALKLGPRTPAPAGLHWAPGWDYGLPPRDVEVGSGRRLCGTEGSFVLRRRGFRALRVLRVDEGDRREIGLQDAPGGSIVGTVTDLNDAPVPGALVAVYPHATRHDADPATFSFEVETDARGRFEAHGFAGGRVNVHARAPGFAMNRSLTVDVFESSVTEASMTLLPSSSVSGRAWRRRGDETVACKLAYVACAAESRRVIRVARDGSYRLDAVVGQLKLVAAPRSSLAADRRVKSRLMSVEPGVAGRWDFVLEDGD